MLKHLFSFTITLALSVGNTFAQLNEGDTLKFQLRASVSGFYQQGNVELLNIRGRLDFTLMLHKHLVIKSQNSTLYQAFYGVKADNDIFSRNFIYYKPQRKLYPFAIAFASSNYRRSISNRYFAGAGLTYRLLAKQNNGLKLSASAVYEDTQFSNTLYNFAEYNGDKHIALWRGTLYASGWTYLVAKQMRLYFDAYWQPAFDTANNYRTQVDVGLDFPVWKGLSFTILYAFTHENVVIENIQQDDTLLTFGLAYSVKTR